MVRIKMADFDKLIDVLEIAGVEAEELRSFARAPYAEYGVYEEKQPGVWWQRVAPIECSARVIKAVHLEVHDGLLQCEEYMRRQFELSQATNVEAKVATRLRRAKDIFSQPNPPECTFIQGEACLYTDMGAPEMMVHQLSHMLKLIDRGYIRILIKPFNAAFAASTYGWTHLQFNSMSMRDFVTVEYEVGVVTIDDDAGLWTFQDRWEKLRAASLDEYHSRQLISQRLKDLKSQLER